MGIAETLLVGIACVMAQDSPEAKVLQDQLTAEELAVIDYIQKNQVCEQLAEYSESQSGNLEDGSVYLAGCSSCMLTIMPLQLNYRPILSKE